MIFSEITLPSNKKFGLFFSIIFTICCLYTIKIDAIGMAKLFAFLAIAFFSVSLIKAELLLPLNKLWMRFGLLLGMIISPIVLGIIFFFLFTPIAMVLRLIGRDELRLKLKSTGSFWKVRKPSDPLTNSFKNQF